MTKPSTIIYIDASHGASGDMLLAAFLDLGFPLTELKKLLSELAIPPEIFSVKKVKKGHFTGLHIDYKSTLKLPTYQEIKKFITSSSLAPEFKKRTLKIVDDFFDAEAVIHKEKKAMVSLDETSNIDFIIEICGVLKAIEFFNPERVYCSSINVGAGLVKTEHGVLPVPAPVTLNLLQNIPLFTDGTRFELTTPTGALLIKHITHIFETVPSIVVAKTGIGAGSASIPHHSNVLRIFLGIVPAATRENITIIETNIDNLSSELLGNLMEQAFVHGALDVYFTPIYIKKNRPAFTLSVLCPPDRARNLIRFIFTETSTLGIRFWESQRTVLERRIVTIDTEYGCISIKEGYNNGELVCANPEFEDCKKIADNQGVPLKKIYEIALQQYYKRTLKLL